MFRGQKQTRLVREDEPSVELWLDLGSAEPRLKTCQCWYDTTPRSDQWPNSHVAAAMIKQSGTLPNLLNMYATGITDNAGDN